MQDVDEARLESDVVYRFEYTSQFMEFGDQDVRAIQTAAPVLAPHVPEIVDAVYAKLFNCHATKRHFVPRQSGYDGDVPVTIDELTLDHEIIQFRKKHLSTYLTNLMTRACNDKMIVYLDTVGLVHTSQAGSTALQVPLVQMNALMGYLSDSLLDVILNLPLDDTLKTATMRAVNKLLWLQSDLITRHYANES